MAKSRKKPKFEDALKRLEALTEEIERGEIGLEESIARYEEGMKLVSQCRKALTDAEQRIQKLAVTSPDDAPSDDDRSVNPDKTQP